MILRTAIAVVIGLVISPGLDLAVLSDEPPSKVDLPKLSINELGQCLANVPYERGYHRSEDGSEYESILCELIRRGGDAAERILSNRLREQDKRLKLMRDQQAAIDAAGEEPSPEDVIDRWMRLSDLQHSEVLTALRRVQQKPDPLAVLVEHPDTVGTRDAVQFQVTLKNVDVEQREIGLQQGGDYRSGRHARWRVHARDEQGNLLPQLPSPSFIAGGLYDHAPLAPGESWTAGFPVNSYVRFLTAGKYTVQILYHDEQTIADFDDESQLKSLILYRSEPFELIVETGPKATIHLTQADMELAREQVKALNEKDEIRLLIGKYDEAAHKFIRPNTPQGRLMTLDWKAVPALIEALEGPQLSYRRRGWILALLFAITREEDLNPMGSKQALHTDCVLPSYRSQGSLGWSRSFGGGFSAGWSGDGFRSAHDENEIAQREFAQRWLRFRDVYVELVIHD